MESASRVRDGNVLGSLGLLGLLGLLELDDDDDEEEEDEEKESERGEDLSCVEIGLSGLSEEVDGESEGESWDNRCVLYAMTAG